MRAILAFLIFLGSATVVMALDAGEMFADAAEEARARDIGRQLRCLVCQNQSIFDSNSGLAKDLRVVVRERMVAGDTDAEVLGFVADRFGDYVLLRPRVSRQTYVLWATPIGLTVLAGVGLWGFYRGRKRLGPDPLELSDEDRKAARRILKEGQG